MSIVMESVNGTTAEKQYWNAVRHMSPGQITRIEDLSDDLLGESEFILNVRVLYKKMLDQIDDDRHSD